MQMVMVLEAGEFLQGGDLTVHIRVNDPDFDVNPAGEDSINQNRNCNGVGPVKISVLRGASTVVLGYAGGPAELEQVQLMLETTKQMLVVARQFGPIDEIAPDAGIYELDFNC